MSPTQPGPVCDIALRRPVFAATPQHTPARRYDATLCPVRRALMRRREFITLLGGAAAAWPLAARAQRSGMRRLGVLMSFAENEPGGVSEMDALRAGLAELGWVEDHNIHFDVRWPGGDLE